MGKASRYRIGDRFVAEVLARFSRCNRRRTVVTELESAPALEHVEPAGVPAEWSVFEVLQPSASRSTAVRRAARFMPASLRPGKSDFKLTGLEGVRTRQDASIPAVQPACMTSPATDPLHTRRPWFALHMGVAIALLLAVTAVSESVIWQRYFGRTIAAPAQQEPELEPESALVEIDL